MIKRLIYVLAFPIWFPIVLAATYLIQLPFHSIMWIIKGNKIKLPDPWFMQALEIDLK